MDVRLVHTKIKLRLNKADSSDFDNIQCYQINEAFNKAQREWCRRQLHGFNQMRESSEQTKQRVSDLHILLKNRALSGNNYSEFYETETLPDDILRFEKVQALAKNEVCKKGKILKIRYIEEGNSDTWISDWALKPSFEWAETFNTLIDNRVRIYTSGEFKIESPTITYYRQPKNISIDGCEDINGNQLGNIDPEFSDDIVELIIDETVSILASDIESFNVMQTAEKRKENNN
jgi:hypothetical protein